MSKMNKYFNDKVGSHRINKTGGKFLDFVGTISSVLKNSKYNVKFSSSSEYKDLDMMLPYGFASIGLKGMRCQVIKNSDVCVIVGMYDKRKPDLERGQVEIYTRDGTSIKLDNDGGIIIKADKKVKINGDLQVTGTINGKNI